MRDDGKPAGEWESMRGIIPRSYVCRRATQPIVIDGRIDEAAWNAAAWTDDFTDIEGSRKTAPRFRTRAKMLWDDDFLYVAAECVEPHVVATITKKNEVIFHDNDFEIFIDPDGDNHNYYEFEVNAFNTIWELTLAKPYKDGGPATHGTNLAGLKSAVHVRGSINDPRDADDAWTVEIALPWKDLAKYNANRATPPNDGDVWRINFSRVQWIHDVIDGQYRKREKTPEDNWVWSPQGIIDMHRPERWGLVLFTTADASREVKLSKTHRDSAMTERDALMEVYHRQRVFKSKHERFAATLKELAIDSSCLSMEPTTDGFVATVKWTDERGTPRELRTRQDSLIW